MSVEYDKMQSIQCVNKMQTTINDLSLFKGMKDFNYTINVLGHILSPKQMKDLVLCATDENGGLVAFRFVAENARSMQYAEALRYFIERENDSDNMPYEQNAVQHVKNIFRQCIKNMRLVYSGKQSMRGTIFYVTRRNETLLKALAKLDRRKPQDILIESELCGTPGFSEGIRRAEAARGEKPGSSFDRMLAEQYAPPTVPPHYLYVSFPAGHLGKYIPRSVDGWMQEQREFIRAFDRMYGLSIDHNLVMSEKHRIWPAGLLQ